MGKCCICCILKCVLCCGKKRSHGKRKQQQDTAPPVANPTNIAISDEDRIQTYQEFVDCLTQQSENRRTKAEKPKKNRGWFAGCLERITCCKLFTKQPPPEPAYWIETPPGYLERRCDDI